MADNTTVALGGLVKTLNDVVASAIPADDPLASQELKLVVRYLDFARQRVDHLYARARFELRAHGDLLTECGQHLAPVDASRANDAAALSDRANELLSEPGAGIGALRELCQEIASTISALLNGIPDVRTLQTVERAVVRASAEMIAFDRSWYAPLKLERFPHEVRPIGSFIPV